MTCKRFILKWFLPSLLRTIASFFLLCCFCFGLFYIWDFYEDPSYDVPVSANRIGFVINSVAKRTINKPQYAIEWEKCYEGREKEKVIYLPKAQACVEFGVESTNEGAKLTPWRCQFNSKGRTDWIGSPFAYGVTFRKAHLMEKDFEEYVLKKNGIPFEKHKPVSSYIARLMTYPLCFMWQTFLFIFAIVFTWIYFERSKRWKQEK